MEPKIWIAPQTLNIVKALCKYSMEKGVNVGLIPSRNQVDFDGGYLEMTTREFVSFVSESGGRWPSVIISRDHGGPNQRGKRDYGYDSLKEDSIFFQRVHLDLFNQYDDCADSIFFHYNEYLSFLPTDTSFEVGTERAIYHYTPEFLDKLIVVCKVKRDIHYAVIQSCDGLKNGFWIGDNEISEEYIRFIEVCKKNNVSSKEHNGDWQPKELIKKKFRLGLGAMNFAPEFSSIENSFLLEILNDKDKNKLCGLCYRSNKWKRWVSEGFSPSKNIEKIVQLSAHYIMQTPEFKDLKIPDDFNEEVQVKIIDRYESLLECTR